MNTVNLIGYLATDPKASGDAATFLLAVRRNYTSQNGETADFVNCVTWGGLATNVLNHLHKGSKIALTGSIKTSHYTDAGGYNRLGWQVVAEQVTFLDQRPKPQQTQQPVVQPIAQPVSQPIANPKTTVSIKVSPKVAQALQEWQAQRTQQAYGYNAR